MLLSPAQRRVAMTAVLRNQALRAAGYGELRVPDCELRGVTDRPARLAYLCGARGDIAFSRSDRTMVLRNRVGAGWWCATDAEMVGGNHLSKAAAFAAGRAAERAADARVEENMACKRAREEPLPVLPPMDDINAWMRTADARFQARQAALRPMEFDMGNHSFVSDNF
jgi:hypothetical protein